MTPEQILALAPDSSSASAGKSLANERKWSNLGVSGNAIWGECQGSGSKPYQTQIDSSEPAFKCSCPSRKFPCKHGIGLYLLFANQNTLFETKAPPEWVEKWLESRQARVEKALQKAETNAQKEADPAQAAKRAAGREAKVEKGLHELELWLNDLIRNGLASAPAQPYTFWDTMATRLVDAQCPALAKRVRELAGIASQGKGWQVEVLARLAKIHLVVEGWKRRSQFDESTVAELRAQIGWTIKEEELESNEGIEDEWWILGQRSEEEDNIRILKTWLWGKETRRPAIALQFAHASQQLVPQFMPQSRLRATAIYYPGATPLRAVFRDKSEIAPLTPDGFAFATSIGEAAQGFHQALTSNPWLDWFPVALQDITLVQQEGDWHLRDGQGDQWKVSSLWQDHWQFLASSGGAPVTLFGEWNGSELRPFGWV